MKKAKAVTLFILSYAASMCATSFYVVKHGNNLYMAGDTLESRYAIRVLEDRFGTHIDNPPVCKLVVSNRYILATAGLLGFSDPKVENSKLVKIDKIFPFARRGNAIIAQGLPPEETVAKLIEAMKSAEYEISVLSFKDFTNRGGTGPLTAGLFWFEGTKAMYEIFTVTPNWEVDRITSYSVDRDRQTELTQDQILTIAHHDALTYEGHPTQEQLTSNPVRALEDYLNLESRINSEVVGQPFTIVRLNESGGAWIKNGDVCAANSHLKQPPQKHSAPPTK